MTDYSLYKKDGNIIIAMDDKDENSIKEPRLAIDDFLCCGPTRWRIRKSEEDSVWTNELLAVAPLNQPHCSNTNFATIGGAITRASFGRKRKTLRKIPETITFETGTHTFSDGDKEELYYCHMPDNPTKKIYLEMDFIQGPCFPADRNPPASNGITKSCVRISPDYFTNANGDLVLNNKATYLFTVSKTLNQGDLKLPNYDISPCTGDTNLPCTLIKNKYVSYDIERTMSPLGELKCCATNPDEAWWIGEEIKTGYIICPQEDSSEDAVVGDYAHDNPENQLRQTTWEEKLILEVLIMDRDGNEDIWVPVMTNDGQPFKFCETTYNTTCWSIETPSNPRRTPITILANTDIEDPDAPSCGDNKIDEPYLGHPPCLDEAE
jgi:hypothetical protein